MTKSSNTFYNTFSLFYPLVDVFLKPQKRILFQEINNLPSGALLEIGVGNGKYLSLYNTHKITGIDTSTSMLNNARKQHLENIELLEMSGENLLFKEHSFDYIVLSHVIAVINHPDKLLEESYRVLKPNGKVYILNHFTPTNWLRHIDTSFQVFARWFHFKSFFRIDSIPAIQKFTLLKEVNIDKLSYFKLLIYSKE